MRLLTAEATLFSRSAARAMLPNSQAAMKSFKEVGSNRQIDCMEHRYLVMGVLSNDHYR